MTRLQILATLAAYGIQQEEEEKASKRRKKR